MRRRTFLVGSVAALLASGAESNAQQARDATGEVNALATLRVQAGKEAEVEAILRDSQSATLANDKGCLRYEWYRASTPQTYILLQRWSDQAAAQDHLNAPTCCERCRETIVAST
jgi:quinol monooxygenase YgiN